MIGFVRNSALRLVASKTTSSDQPSHKAGGMDYTPTKRRLPALPLNLRGALVPPSLAAATVE